MGYLERLSDATAVLLGRSAYQAPPPDYAGGIDNDYVENMRRAQGGQLQRAPYTRTRWYLSDLEMAERLADNGNLELAAQLWSAARRDGRLGGVLSTRTGGLVRLPKRFRGDPDVVAALELGHDTRASVRSVFDEMFPPTELALLAADGIGLGVGVGELVPVEGRDYPVFVRLHPEFLVYRWYENRWYFNSNAGLLPIVPGDGRWILHTPGGRLAPWQNGQWRCIGRAYIRKEHALLHKDNYEGKLANPARVAVSPQGGSEPQKQAWFRSVMAWGVNTVFGMTPGYDVKLIESNGRGWEAFDTTVSEQNTEMIIAIAGQTVTTDGGAGFQNSDIHKTIRADLIQETGDAVSHTINTQGIPAFVAQRWGVEAVEDKVCVFDYDVTPPKDRNAEAQSLTTTAQAIAQLTEALRAHGRQLDVGALAVRFAIPVLGDANGDGGTDTVVSPAAAVSAPTNVRSLPKPRKQAVEDDDEEAAA